MPASILASLSACAKGVFITFGALRWGVASTTRTCSRVAMYFNAATLPAYIRLLTSYMRLWPWAVSQGNFEKRTGQGLEQGRVHPGTRPGKTGPGAFFLRARPGPGPSGCC
jgi:hypothetical protein